MYLTDRIELIGGKVVAAGSLEGSFNLLRVLLESWTAHAALGLVSGDFDPWIAALSADYGISAEKIEERIAAEITNPLTASLNFSQLFPDDWPSTERMLKNLSMSAHQSNLWFANGPGFAVRIGGDAPTPDFVIAQSHTEFRFSESHLEGVPEIVVETAGPHKDLPHLKKLYAGHGIPEVWEIDLAAREFKVLENRGGYYQVISRLNGGVYNSVAVSGLVVNINLLWDLNASPESMFGAVLLDERGLNSIVNYSRAADVRAKSRQTASVRRGQIPFKPRLGFDAGTVSFEEFISWAPERKFDIDGNRLVIESRIGSRNMIGMLLQSVGLKDAVAALPLNDWITAIAERRLQIASSVHIKKYLAREVKRAAEVLKGEFDRQDLRTFGWMDEEPGMWTRVKIVDMQSENGGPPYREIRAALHERFDGAIEFVGVESLAPGDRQVFERRSLTV